jgi:uncharacterized membrane protein YecN with MAPEG domain
MEESMTFAIVCAALLGLLVFGLGLAVSLARGKEEALIGYDSDPTNRLHKFVRAHANACEYAPMMAVLILYLGSQDPSGWVVAVMGVATGARYLHAAGMILPATLAEPNPMRLVGALGTYLGGFALVAATLLSI